MKRQNLEKKLLSNARAIIAHEVAIPMGCIHMSKILSWLGPDIADQYPVFDSYMDEVQALPLAQERLKWNCKTLLEKDQELQLINQKYRKDILIACFDIIDKNHQKNSA